MRGQASYGDNVSEDYPTRAEVREAISYARRYPSSAVRMRFAVLLSELDRLRRLSWVRPKARAGSIRHATRPARSRSKARTSAPA